MSLTENYSSPLPLFFPFHRSKKPHPSPSKSFEDTLILRLKSILPVPQSISLAWLSLAADILSATLSAAAALISDPSLSGSDRSALSSHLDASLALLDALNSISAEIERLSRGRLLLRFVLHLLSSENPPSPKIVGRARESIKEWEESPRYAAIRESDVQIRKLIPSDLPRGKISAVRRAIYALEAVSSLVAGAIASVLGGGESRDFAGIRVVSGELPWADAFNRVGAAVSGDHRVGLAVEVEAVEAVVRRLAAVIDGEDDGEKTERLLRAVEETEKATEELTEGLDRLSNAVNGVFHVALGARNLALQSFRIGPQ